MIPCKRARQCVDVLVAIYRYEDWELASFTAVSPNNVQAIACHNDHQFANIQYTTRTSRTPAFWWYSSEDTPPPTSWLTILLSHIGSQVKRRQSQSYKFKEFVKITHFWRHRADTILSTDGWTDGQTNGQGENSIPPFQLRWSRGHNELYIFVANLMYISMA